MKCQTIRIKWRGFKGLDPQKMEDEINTWFANNPGKNVKNVTQIFINGFGILVSIYYEE